MASNGYICVRACVWAGLGEHRAEQVTSVSYCARDGCCWHDERPIPGEEEWQGRTPAKRGARIGLLLTLSNKTEHAERYGKITVFCDDERLGEMDAGQILDVNYGEDDAGADGAGLKPSGALFWVAAIGGEGDR